MWHTDVLSADRIHQKASDLDVKGNTTDTRLEGFPAGPLPKKSVFLLFWSKGITSSDMWTTGRPVKQSSNLERRLKLPRPPW